ncbi:hypothetical protein HC891_15145 [Candidatus Gracilibacteria bacterium]|nr:hypothetical protein [Candidatus Gracilibacteria bacterium]
MHHICNLESLEPPLSIALLGPPLLVMHGAPLTLNRRQVKALLYRLAAAP